MVTICLGRRLPGDSSDRYPRARRAALSPEGDALLLGLAPDGVCLAGRSPCRRWALTPPFHPYPENLSRDRPSWRFYFCGTFLRVAPTGCYPAPRSEEHTSELQSHSDLVCRLLLEKKKSRSAMATNCGLLNTVHMW